MGLSNPPERGSYRDCRLEAATGPNTATEGEDYRLPDPRTASRRLRADENWRASFAIEVVADDVDEEAETFTIVGKCGGTGDATPRHTALQATTLTLQIADVDGDAPPPRPPPPPPPPSGTPALVVSLPSSALAAPDQCDSGDHPCVAEGAGEVQATLTLRDPPSSGSYRTCLLEVADGPNTAANGTDYRLPERSGDRARLSAQTDWQATLPLTFLADAEDSEGTELFTVRARCGGSSEEAAPRHGELAAIPLTIQIADGAAVQPPPPPPASSSAATLVLSLPASVLAAGQCDHLDHPCVAESAGEVAVTLRIDNPPAAGGYRTCLLEVAASGPNTATSGTDYRLPERSGDRARLSAQTGWHAALPLAIVADNEEEAPETFTLVGKCGGTTAGTSPHHTELAATALTVRILDGAPGPRLLAPIADVELRPGDEVTARLHRVFAPVDGQQFEFAVGVSSGAELVRGHVERRSTDRGRQRRQPRRNGYRNRSRHQRRRRQHRAQLHRGSRARRAGRPGGDARDRRREPASRSKSVFRVGGPAGAVSICRRWRNAHLHGHGRPAGPRRHRDRRRHLDDHPPRSRGRPSGFGHYGHQRQWPKRHPPLPPRCFRARGAALVSGLAAGADFRQTGRPPAAMDRSQG